MKISPVNFVIERFNRASSQYAPPKYRYKFKQSISDCASQQFVRNASMTRSNNVWNVSATNFTINVTSGAGYYYDRYYTAHYFYPFVPVNYNSGGGVVQVSEYAKLEENENAVVIRFKKPVESFEITDMITDVQVVWNNGSPNLVLTRETITMELQ